MNNIPFQIRQLAARYKTQGGSVRRDSHETHDLSSLSQRLMLSPAETLQVVARGELLSLDSRNGAHLFSSASLDNIRNRTIEFIAQTLVEEMGAAGYGNETIAIAFERTMLRQTQLSRGECNLVQFDSTDDDDQNQNNGFLKSAKQSAGDVAGVGAGLGAGYGLLRGYQYLKNRYGSQQGGNGNAGSIGDGSTTPTPPTPSDPSSGAGIESHPPGVPTLQLPESNPTPKLKFPTKVAEGSLLNGAAAEGRGIIGRAGSALLRALMLVE